jgi:inner membrane protein
MHREGHRGIVLLALAPVLYRLFTADQPVLALLACGVLVIEPLPDKDFVVPGLSHRGVSHSLLTAALIGALCASVGWAIGTYVTRPLLPWLQANVLVGPQWTTWTATHFAVLDAASLVLVGFWVGAGGICLHLLGDVITTSGIQPLVPFSRWTLNPSPLRAANPLVNRGLFVLGVVATVAVVLALTPLGDRLFSLLGPLS